MMSYKILRFREIFIWSLWASICVQSDSKLVPRLFRPLYDFHTQCALCAPCAPVSKRSFFTKILYYYWAYFKTKKKRVGSHVEMWVENHVETRVDNQLEKQVVNPVANPHFKVVVNSFLSGLPTRFFCGSGYNCHFVFYNIWCEAPY